MLRNVTYVHVVPFHISLYIPQRPGLSGACKLPSQEGLAMARKLVSKKELKSVYGIPYCFAHIARLEKVDQFPHRVVLGACRVAWFAEEVEEWIESRPRA
jgi:prophage regulatory protein